MQVTDSSWRAEYLRLLRATLDAQQDAAQQLWKRTRWLRWFTLPALPMWLGLRVYIDHSEAVWQAMWIVETAPERATARQHLQAYFGMPRTRGLAHAQLRWVRVMLREVVWLCVAVSLCVYLTVGLVVMSLLR